MFDFVFDFLDVAMLEQGFKRLEDARFAYLLAMAEQVGQRVEDEAKGMMGTYQPAAAGIGAAFPAWTKLSAVTMRIRAARGINAAEEPLLETQRMKDIIKASEPQKSGPEEVTVAVGYEWSSSGSGGRSRAYELFHELGTKWMPARPVLGPAAIRVMKTVHHLFEPITMNFFSILSTGTATMVNTVGNKTTFHNVQIGTPPAPDAPGWASSIVNP